MRLIPYLFIAFCLMAGLFAVNASSANFGMGSFHQGLAGMNGTSTNFEGRSTMTYQQPSNQNTTSFHFFANIGWFDVRMVAPSAINELISIFITYPYTGSMLGMEVSNCHLIISIETNATNASTINQNISMWTTNGSGIYELLNSYQTTDLNHSFNITVPANMVDNEILLNGTSRTIGTINYTNNVSATIVGTSFCTGGTNSNIGLAGGIIWITIFIFLAFLWYAGLDRIIITWFGVANLIATLAYAEIVSAVISSQISGVFDMLFVLTTILFTIFTLFIMLEFLSFFLAKMFNRKYHSFLFARLEVDSGYGK